MFITFATLAHAELCNCPAGVAGHVLLDFPQRVVATLPMQDHLDSTVLDAHDDLMQNDAVRGGFRAPVSARDFLHAMTG